MQAPTSETGVVEGASLSRGRLGEWGRGWFVRSMVYVRGREDLGIVLGPPVRGTELGLEILGPWACCSLELSFPIHTMGRQRGDILLGLWNQEMPWRLRKKLSPNLVSKNPVAGVDAAGVGSRASYPINQVSLLRLSFPLRSRRIWRVRISGLPLASREAQLHVWALCLMSGEEAGFELPLATF